MKRLTPAGVSTLMVVVVGLFVTAYFAKLMRAEEPHKLAATQLPAVDRSVPTATPSDTVAQERTTTDPGVRERIAQGSVVRSSQNPPVDRHPITVARGMRAVAISVPQDLPTTSGLFKEGQYVDVYLTPRSDASGDAQLARGVTLTLLRGVRLLTTTPIESADQTSCVVTLELTPDQATALVLAREKGILAISYNPEGKGDGGIALKQRDRATFDEILGATADRARPTPATFTTEVYKGTTRSIRQFDERTKVGDSSMTPSGFDSSGVAPLWTRRSSARSLPTQVPDRMSLLPDQTILR